MSQLKKVRFIFFEGEKLPFKVMAVSENYAVVSSWIDQKMPICFGKKLKGELIQLLQKPIEQINKTLFTPYLI